jgi:hydrogenase expression/formation protein HypD
LVSEVFEVTDRKWRGIGTIPQSGLRLRPAYAQFDAESKFSVEQLEVLESSECISGLILQGVRKPHDCPAFGKTCTPERPLGATMVSSEGACAAYYNYGRFREAEAVHA